MKKMRYISGKVKVQIVADYKARSPNGDFTYTLHEIADKYEISLSTVNNLARLAHCQGRPHGKHKQVVPTARTMKILRDAMEPGIDQAEVGRRNPYWTTIDGKRVLVPLSKQRVSQLVAIWARRGNPGVKPRGFRAGDVIEWGKQRYTVVRYDNDQQGAVERHGDGKLLDPFYWVRGSSRSKRITAPVEPVDKS